MVYRLTRKIINVVKSILPNADIVTTTSGRMEEIQVTLAHANTRESELVWVWHNAKRFTETGHPSVIILSDHTAVKEFIRIAAEEEGLSEPDFPNDSWGRKTDYSVANDLFLNSSADVCLQYLGNSYGSLKTSDSSPVVYVMTYHSVKGLDFRTVFLPLLTPDTVFWSSEDISRRLFFVGATRSRRDLFMSYHGVRVHKYVEEMPQEELHKIEISQSDSFDSDDDFIF